MNKKKFNLPEEKKIVEYLKKIKFFGFEKENKKRCLGIDQKNTYDVLNIVCKCILNLTKNKTIHNFNYNIFLKDEYSKKIFEKRTKKNGKAILKKKTNKEYDKLFWNNFELLSYLEILEKNKYKNKNNYKIINKEILKILSESEEACVVLICLTVYKIIKNIKIKNFWFKYLKKPNKFYFEKFKEKFIESFKFRTKHNNDVKQIFLKFINPLFFLFNLKKFNSNKNTKNIPQTILDISYFKIHVRDKNKKYGFTRKENKEKIKIKELSETKQKKDIKNWNQKYYKNKYKLKENEYISEKSEKKDKEKNFHVHHIWPKFEFNDDSNCLPNIYENLILLTIHEHMVDAHDGSGKQINKKELKNLLWKQFEKINEFKKARIGNYKYYEFYKLICQIKNIKPIEEQKIQNKEKIIGFINELLNEKEI